MSSHQVCSESESDSGSTRQRKEVAAGTFGDPAAMSFGVQLECQICWMPIQGQRFAGILCHISLTSHIQQEVERRTLVRDSGSSPALLATLRIQGQTFSASHPDTQGDEKGPGYARCGLGIHGQTRIGPDRPLCTPSPQNGIPPGSGSR
jgi:hypothetical protein